MNSDRKASYAIAVKSLLERKDYLDRKPFQISNRRGLVNDLRQMSCESGLLVAVRHSNHLDGKPNALAVGSFTAAEFPNIDIAH